MADPLLECMWGKIRIFASNINVDGGRTQVVHELSSGDRHPVQDRGLRVRRTRLQIQFDNFPGQPPPAEAARILDAAKNTGQIAIFQHPLLGRWPASIGEFHITTDEHSVISAEAEFIKEDDDIAILPTGTDTSSAAGEAAVSAAAELLDSRLVDVGQLKISGPAASSLLSQLPGGSALGSSLSPSLSTDLSVDLSVEFSASLAVTMTANAQIAAGAVATGSASAGVAAFVGAAAFAGVGASASADVSVALAAAASADASAGLFAATTLDARVAVSLWSSGDVPTRQILIDAARISNNIATMIEVGGFEDDLALYPAFQSAIMLGESVRSAAIAATSETPSVFVMRVVQSTALLPLAARIYGGKNAQERARQISSLNDISTVGWLPPGDYLMPTRPAPAPF